MNIDDTIKTIESAIPEETKYQEWQPIKDTLKLDDPPPFPVEALPPALRDMAEGISLSRKVPLAISATAVLAAVGWQSVVMFIFSVNAALSDGLIYMLLSLPPVENANLLPSDRHFCRFTIG